MLRVSVEAPETNETNAQMDSKQKRPCCLIPTFRIPAAGMDSEHSFCRNVGADISISTRKIENEMIY